jgi:hypothetical protein
LSNLDPPLHPKGCGPCEDCREALADYATIPAYAERLPQDGDGAQELELAFWERLSQPFAPPGLDPNAVGHAMTYASGAQAGEHARRFWASRIAADKAAVPFTAPTAGQLRRHEQKFMPRDGWHHRDARKRHRQAAAEVARVYGLSGKGTDRISELRAEGKTLAEISNLTGASEREIRQALRAA